MKRFSGIISLFLLTQTFAFSANDRLEADSVRVLELEDVLIVGSRAGDKTPVAQTNLRKTELKALTLANHLPHVLELTPSIISTSENGTAAGYSSFRIRGTDASRINVTLNGIPMNNPESQEVYWVNLPDMTSGLQHIQVQRGAGTSTNGTGSFGASVHMRSALPTSEAFVESATTVGSYGTFQQNIAAGTGLLGQGVSLDVRYSNLSSDGYIRNGWLDHESLFATLNKASEHSNLRIHYLYGNQHTGITWEGVAEDAPERYNPAGEIKDGVYYDNESDNYRQHHLQAFYAWEAGKNWWLNTAVNYTNGFGYYEQYKQGESFDEMGIPNQILNDGSHTESDLIRRKNMKNDYYVAQFNAQYNRNRFSLKAGSMYSYYDGDHFATLLWVEQNQNIPNGFEWVRNNGKKTDANAFVKMEYDPIDHLTLYADLQERYVHYVLKGIDDDDMRDMSQTRTWYFFNPKAGLSWMPSTEHRLYASVGMAHREPTRADIKDARKQGSNNNVQAEELIDYELGYQWSRPTVAAGIQLYFMDYNRQLIPTGKLNDVGYKLMSNVDRSYRAGLELTAAWQPVSWMKLDGNASFSRNRVLDYTVYYETYDNPNDWGDASAQISQHFDQAKLPYSPEWSAAGGLRVYPIQEVELNVTSKWVGEQYVTNTMNDALMLPNYQFVNAGISWNIPLRSAIEARLSFTVNNVLSARYSSNAWGYEARFEDGSPAYIEKGIYPVAPRHYLAKFAFRF
ncbi:MAG TPA: TonB-dependent receptor [Bacteroidales bacterium]|nr:TonB-dependent receptor [Bacteroidales bacterium]